MKALELVGMCGIALALAQCGSSGSGQATSKVITIGALADKTGPSATLAYYDAINLAQTQMNEGLSQAGANFRFDVHIMDSQSTPTIAGSDMLALVNTQGAKAIVSDNSADTVAAGKYFYQSPSQLSGPVPIACYLCSSSFFNNPTATSMDPPPRPSTATRTNGSIGSGSTARTKPRSTSSLR